MGHQWGEHDQQKWCLIVEDLCEFLLLLVVGDLLAFDVTMQLSSLAHLLQLDPPLLLLGEVCYVVAK